MSHTEPMATMFRERATTVKASENIRPEGVAYVSPFTNTTNRYIELQKALLEELGYEVRPFSLRQLAPRELLRLRKNKGVVALHWLETRLFRRAGAGITWSWVGWAEFTSYVVLLKALRCRTIYFVHDHSVHDAAPWQRTVSRFAVRFLCSLATERVVHDPSFCHDYKAKYLPHPLYWDSKGASSAAPSTSTPPRETRSHAKDVKFGIFGALRRYKRIGDVLEVWPRDAGLEIRGKGDPEYVGELTHLIQQRQLQAVSIENRFVSDEQLTTLLRTWDVLILPHDAHSMLVSGAFFEAIGLVPALIMRETPFSTWCSSVFQGVFTFRRPEELPGLVDRVRQHIVAARDTTWNEAEATRRFGWRTCVESYGALWQNVAKGRS